MNKEIVINHDSVLVCGVTIPRPARISVQEWVRFWQNARGDSPSLRRLFT